MNAVADPYGGAAAASTLYREGGRRAADGRSAGVDISTLTKKQHYVWAHHLGAWEVDGVVWCHLAEQQKLFPTNRDSLANETFFYRAQKLTTGDLAALDYLINRSTDGRLRELNRRWVCANQLCFEARQAVEDAALPAEEKAQPNLVGNVRDVAEVTNQREPLTAPFDEHEG